MRVLGFVSIVLVVFLLGGLCGFLIRNSMDTDTVAIEEPKNDIIGTYVYEGSMATYFIALCENGIMYSYGFGNGTWSVEGDTIHLIPSSGNEEGATIVPNGIVVHNHLYEKLR